MATTYDKASLVMIPSGYKDDKLYSIKPTDGSGDFTFSRDGAGASPATRVNASGLIEKGRTNELTYSNDFSNAAWSKVSATITGGQADKDGGSNAWLLDATADGGNILNSNSLTGVKSFSCYMKAGTASWGRLRFDNSPSADVNVWFNLSTGAVGTNNNGIHAYTEDAGSGWYRAVIIGNSSDLSNVRIYVADSDGTDVTNGLNIYIQDAQLEQGLVATSVIETTTAPVSAGLLGDMPRLDYSGGATCPSLLLEPSRVNNLPYSEYFDTDWVKSNASITSNYATSPEGVSNASLMTISAAFGNIYDAQGGSGDYAFSVYAKYVDMQYIRLRSTGSYVYFDIQNGSVETELNGTGYIEDAGNGWYKCSVVGNNTNTLVQIYLSDTEGTGNPTGTGSALLYGAQFEQGSYPTSYIPTYGSASTRGADSCVKTGISSLIGQTEGAFYIEATALETTAAVWFGLGEGVNNRILIGSSGQDVRTFVSANGNSQSYTSSISTLNTYKALVNYSGGDYDFYVNGSKLTTLSLGSMGVTLDTFKNGNLVNTNQDYEGNLKQALLFPTALTDAECIALTTI